MDKQISKRSIGKARNICQVIYVVVKSRIMSKTATKATNTTVNMVSLFSALADQTRLRLINLIGDDEVCVCFLTDVLETNQPKISRHLAYLYRAGLVTARRQGKWMYYRLVKPSDPHAAQLLAQLRAWCAENPEMQHDRAQLSKLCCNNLVNIKEPC
jgi:ArsR family transcriptional regulator